MPFYAFLLMCLLSCLFLHFINLLIAYSLFNAGSLSMGKGIADGSGLLSKLAARVSQSGRPRSVPPRLIDDDSSQGGRGTGAPSGGGSGGEAQKDDFGARNRAL